MKAMEPLRRASIAGKKARVRLKPARYGTSIMASASSAVVSVMGSQRPAPALLMRMSGAPNSREIRAAISSVARLFDKSTV